MPRRGQYKNPMSIDLGALFNYLAGTGVAPTPMPTVPTEGLSPESQGLYGPPTANQAAYDVGMEKVRAQPFTATNAFGKPRAQELNNSIIANRIGLQDASATELQTFENMTPLFLERMERLGLIDNKQKLEYQKALLSPEMNQLSANKEKAVVGARGEAELVNAFKMLLVETQKAINEVLVQHGIAPTKGDAMNYIDRINPAKLDALLSETKLRGNTAQSGMANLAREEEKAVATHPTELQSAIDISKFGVKQNAYRVGSFEEQVAEQNRMNRLAEERAGLENVNLRLRPVPDGGIVDITTGKKVISGPATMTDLLGNSGNPSLRNMQVGGNAVSAQPGYNSKTVSTALEPVRPSELELQNGTPAPGGIKNVRNVTVGGRLGDIVDGVFYPKSR